MTSRHKGILSSSFIVGVWLFVDIGTALVEKGNDIIEVFLSAWLLGAVIAFPFWLVFEAIVEKIKE